MKKDTVKGKAKDIAGRIKRQTGEWTDNERLQGEGAAEQMEGKVQAGVGRAKEAGEDLVSKVRSESEEFKARQRRKKAA